MHKMIVSSCLVFGFIPLSHAGDAGNPVELPGVLVTATRSEIPQNELAVGATVIDRADIERSQVKTLPDLLKGAMGLDVAQSGGYGQTTDVFLRGANPGHVLVLIDGIKAGSATTGTFPYELIPLDQIERVEITRGPQSSLYGSEAIGGVIQIFTRKADVGQNAPKFTLQAGGGSYDTAQTAANVSGAYRENWYGLGVSHLNSQGFNAKQNSDPDRDGYVNTGLNARFGHRFANQAELEASLLRSEGTNAYDSASGGDNSAFVNQTISLSGNLPVAEHWRSRLRLGQSEDNLDTFFSGGQLESRFNTTRWNASWVNQLQWSDNHQWLLGADYRLDEVASNDLDTFNPGFDSYREKSRYDTGVFGEWHGRWQAHYVNASLRWDTNQAFGNYVTGSVGWRYNSSVGISPFARFGNAFKAPTFNDLYWPDTGFGGGNPHLKPEESRAYEVGLAGTHPLGNWELRAYHTDVEQLISGWPPVNVGKARIEGLEAELNARWLGWRQTLTLGWLAPVDTMTGLRLQRRTDKTLALDVSRSFGAFELGTKVLAQADRPDLFFDTSTFETRRVNLPGFVTVDLRAAYRVNKHWQISAKLNNVFNEIYQTAYAYNTADRNFFVNLHYKN